MNRTKKTAVRLPQNRQKPIKTEWNSRCVLFTYFQGDISSVVDEHFSRALGNIESSQGLSPSSQNEDVILKNDSDTPPNQWRFSSPRTKPQPEVSPANHATNCNLNVPGPLAVDLIPPSPQPVEELWHFSSLASPSSPEPGYSQVFPEDQLGPEPQPDEKCEPLLSFLQEDGGLGCPQESATKEDYNPVQAAGSTGLLLNLPSSSAHYKKVHVSPERGPAGTSLAREITVSFLITKPYQPKASELFHSDSEQEACMASPSP
ncbi:transcription cofactor vestigial-like protein 1 [Carlito syrichta]|uniref:Transcription cofactor vestigial-like protein 1 n=1 Tax=Carlito syrichta TaxID=1868482 RepID=A0A3Q0EFG4_CARSF|nr:transcription cofactor vestigial-like protein 1 [Carlito syrichta]